MLGGRDIFKLKESQGNGVLPQFIPAVLKAMVTDQHIIFLLISLIIIVIVVIGVVIVLVLVLSIVVNALIIQLSAASL